MPFTPDYFSFRDSVFDSNEDDNSINTLDPNAENPFAGIHSDEGLLGSLSGRYWQFAGGVASGVMGMGAAVTDLFDLSDPKRVAQEEAAHNALVGYQQITPTVDPFPNDRRPGSVLSAVSGALREGSEYFGDIVSANAPPMDEGGSIIDEIQSDLGVSGEGYNPLTYMSSFNPLNVKPWELVEDVAGQVGSIGAGMAAMAATGGPKGIPGYGSIGTGMALQTFGETYLDNTENSGDNRAIALGSAAVNAAVSGWLEKIGWETGLGKGFIAKAVEGSKELGRLEQAAVRSIYTALTEGTEEGLQGVVDILAKRLPDLQNESLDTVSANMYSDMQQIPEQVAGGGIFGGVLGGFTGALRLGAKDADARHGGNTAHPPEARLANAIDKGPATEQAKDLVINMADEIQDEMKTSPLSDPDSIAPQNVDLSPELEAWIGTDFTQMDEQRKQAKLVRLELAAKSAMAHKPAVENLIQEVVDHEEAVRAEIANSFHEEDVNKIENAVAVSVSKEASETAAKVDAIRDTFQNMYSIMQQGGVLMPASEEGGEPILHPVQITPEEIMVAMAEKGIELGIALPDALVSSPETFDFEGWKQAESTQVAESTQRKLDIALEPIREAIPSEEGVSMASPKQSLTGAPVASQAPSSPRLASQQMKAAVAQENSGNSSVPLPAEKWYKPNMLPIIQSKPGLSLREAMGSTLATPAEIRGYLEAKWGSVAVAMSNISPDIEEFSKWNQAAASLETESGPKNETKYAHAQKMARRALNNIEAKVTNQLVPHFEDVAPDIEALSQFTSSVPFVYGKSSNNPGATLEAELTSRTGDPDLVAKITEAGKAESRARLSLPWVKTALYNIWQTAPQELQDRVAMALDVDAGVDVNLGKDVMAHLASQGLFLHAASVAKSDPVYAAKMGRMIADVGKGVMSPWGIKRLVMANGATEAEADSTVAVASAMADQWVAEQKGTVWEFWDRLADQVRLMDYRSSDISGLATAYSKKTVSELSKITVAGKGLMRVFTKLSSGQGIQTTLHELIHQLYMSGLMWEMLDQKGRDAMEDMAKEKLWGPDGEPLPISAIAHEYLAKGFERFLYENKAPTPAMARAFGAVKDFMLAVFHRMVNATSLAFGGLPEMQKARLLSGPDAEVFINPQVMYDMPSKNIKMRWEDIKVGKAQVRAFYMLLNANPDGSETPITAPGLATAVENELGMNTGLSAKGAITHMQPASVITLPFFEKGRVVTADDLPDAEEAKRTRWFHGSGLEMSDGTFLSSLFSRVGLVGTGVYLTDDPKVAETYRAGGSKDGRGDVYALHVEPRKVINLERPLDKEVLDIVSETMIKYLKNAPRRYGYSPGEPVSVWANDRVNEIQSMLLDKDIININFIQWLSSSIHGASDMEKAVFRDAMQLVEKQLRVAGYDALTHIGGLATNANTKHRVLVLLDPNLNFTSKDLYPQTIISQWGTKKVDVESIEEGWQFDSGVNPTMDQWKAMTGLVNPDSDGTHTQDTYFNTEGEREDMGEMSREIQSAPSPKYSQEAATNKAVQDMMAEDAPMIGSATHDIMMDHFTNYLMGNSKDAYYSGAPTNMQDPESLRTMLANFFSKIRYAASEGSNKVEAAKAISRHLKIIGRGVLKKAVSPAVKIALGLEANLGSVSAQFERMVNRMGGMTAQERERIKTEMKLNKATDEQIEKALKDRENVYLNMNLPAVAEAMNNHYALSKQAEKVAEMRPKLWDSSINDWKNIPGALSFNEIVLKFTELTGGFWQENETRLPYRNITEYGEAVRRDFRLYLLAKRQKEIEQNVAEDMAIYEREVAQWENKVKKEKKRAEDSSNELGETVPQILEKPKKPKGPKITPEGSHAAGAIISLMNARYGKSIAMFDVTAARMTQWENHMVLDKLLNAQMISQKAYDDMTRKGKSHVPMYRLRAMLERSGVQNVRLDASVYRPLDYLRNDISVSVEDPVNAMLRKAQAIEVLTLRQAAKNAIGERILADLRWWDSDNPESKVHIFSQKVEVTEQEWHELNKSDDPHIQLTQATKWAKDPMGNKINKGPVYYKHVPLTSEEVEKQVQTVLKSIKNRTSKTDELVRQRLESNVFAFFPEPGKAMYVLVTDPDLAKAFYHMNNPQVMYVNSMKERMSEWLNASSMSSPDADLLSKIVFRTLKAAHTGYYGMNAFTKAWATANPQFLVNSIPRDAFPSPGRSRHGFRLRDYANGAAQSFATMFPTIRENDPDRYAVAEDSATGMSTFSGIAASNLKGELDFDVIYELMHNRNKAIKHGSKLGLMWNDVSQFLAKEGLNKSLQQVNNELSQGKNIFPNVLYMAKSPFVAMRSLMQFIGTFNENATRLAERGLTMSEDMTQYPTLAHMYNPELAIDGRLLAGFSGSEHRSRWEKAKAKLASDPSYKVAETDMPIQFNSSERDYSQAHISLQFAQKGYWSQNLNDHILFFNVSAQDTYTHLMKIVQHSAVQKAVAYAMGEQYVPLSNQARLDEGTWRWVYKNFFYMTLPALAGLALYGHGDDDDSLDWQSQSFFEKLSYIWLPLNKVMPSVFKRPVRIASGIGMATMIFRDLPYSMYLQMAEIDKKAMGKMLRRFFDGTPIGALGVPALEFAQNGLAAGLVSLGGRTIAAPEGMNPMYELMTNKDEFRDRPIRQSTTFDDRDPSEVGSEKYNILVNTLARKLNFLKAQPAEVDYMIRRYFPGSLRGLPQLANKAMEMATGADGVPSDMMPSNSPLVGNVTGVMPRITSREPWGMGNEFVRDLLNTAREATTKRNTYDQLVETRKAQYKAENPIIDDAIYWPLQNASEMVIDQNNYKRDQLKAGLINQLQASEIERTYTLLAHQTMNLTLNKLEGE